jgi:bifunctional non-homologous end joining protein LigD
LRDALDDLGLQPFAKTSGGKGLQVYVPLNGRRVPFEQTKAFARQVAELLERQTPELVVSNMKKSLRHGKVLVDWSQNDRHKTTVCAYSLRARAEPTVSTPVTWQEVERGTRRRGAQRLVFSPDQVLARVAKQGDLFEPTLTLTQRLPKAA